MIPPPDDLDADEPRLLEPAAAALFLGVTTRQLRRWRHELVGPPFFRIAGRVRYLDADLVRWLEAQRVRTVDSPKEPAPARRAVR